MIDQTIKELDVALIKADENADSSKLPYYLRAKALDYPLKPFELGRALYHLAQRRGFKSNKRADAKTDSEERGKVKEGIRREAERMQAQGARTRGEMLSKEDPETERIRARSNFRDWIEHEFNTIWEKQRDFHPGLLTDELRSEIHKRIFDQLPLKPMDHLVGYCSLEPGRWIKVKRYKRRDGRPLDKPRLVSVFKAPRRLALADPLAQQIRLLQRLNDLKIKYADRTTGVLTPEQRTWLLEQLQNGDVSLKDIRKQLGLKKQDSLNFESGFKSMVGNRTAGKMKEILGKTWDSYTELHKSKLVYQILKSQNISDLKSELEAADWRLEPDIAARLADVDLEDGYLAFSRTACEKLLPGLEAGRSLNSIREEIYGASKPQRAVNELPRVAEAFPDLRNPVVRRVLTELRKVVKAIIRRWGMPLSFTLELARELKKTREARKAVTDKIEKRTKERERARKELIDGNFVTIPKDRDIDKYLLWKECGARCPYTGKSIGGDLFSAQSTWDIEHIIPKSRSLDDSFANKTLCCSEFNRIYKHSKLPTELGTEKMKEIISRVQKWPDSQMKTEKLERFLQTEIDDDFSSVQLNDTAYATRLACKYLAMLYGGAFGSEGRRILTTKGHVTAELRGSWGLNKLLGGFKKNRGDHRHHAIDAVVVALTTSDALKLLTDAWKKYENMHYSRFPQIPPPLDNLFETAAQALDNLVISRQLKGKLSGRLHEETNYGLLNDEVKTIRAAVGPAAEPAARLLTIGNLKHDFEIDGVGIIDPVIKNRILIQLDFLGESDPKKAFKDPKNLPYLETKEFKRIPIRKVKLAFKQKTEDVGEKYRIRHVIPGSNHHMAIFESIDQKGETKWDFEIVTLLEAARRHAKREPIVNRNKDGFRFLMTLRAGDTVRYIENGKMVYGHVETITSGIYITARGISKPFGRIGITMQYETLGQKSESYTCPRINAWCKKKLEKVQIDPIGEIRISRD